MTIQRACRGPIAFLELDPMGRYIVVENTGSGRGANKVPFIPLFILFPFSYFLLSSFLFFFFFFLLLFSSSLPPPCVIKWYLFNQYIYTSSSLPMTFDLSQSQSVSRDS